MGSGKILFPSVLEIHSGLLCVVAVGGAEKVILKKKNHCGCCIDNGCYIEKR